jgi:HEAT repeat protein
VEALDAARGWLASGDDDARCVGFDVLDHLALNDETIWPFVVAEVQCSAHDPSREVRDAAANALRHVELPETLPLWLDFAADPEPQIRLHAACHLPALFDATSADERVVSTLLAGLEDPDPYVRDWSAFGLGRQLDIDSHEVRTALAGHLTDDGADTAGEAAVGLARRRDERVLPVLLDQLAGDDVGNLYVEAALAYGDPRLLPLLERLREHGWQSDEPPARAPLLEKAIERCRKRR